MSGRTGRRWGGWIGALLMLVASGCAGGDDDDDRSASETRAPASTRTDSTTTTALPDTTASPAPATSVAAAGSRPTVDELLAREEPLVIVHQGAEHDFPSSTVYAYGESVRAGADMLELDVQLSADGEIVVIHDTSVDDRTDGRGAVADMTAAELAELDAAHWFVPGCGSCRGRPPGDYPYRGVRTGERPPPDGYTADDFGIPTLRQVAERFPRMPLDIEIKGGPEGRDTVEPLAAELRDLGLTESAVVATFDHGVAEAFQQHAPEIDVSPGEDGLLAWLAGNDPLDGYRIIQIPHRYEGIGDILVPEILGRLRESGFAVWVWIGEGDDQTPALYEDILSRGVDGILADRVTQLRRIVDNL